MVCQFCRQWWKTRLGWVVHWLSLGEKKKLLFLSVNWLWQQTVPVSFVVLSFHDAIFWGLSFSHHRCSCHFSFTLASLFCLFVFRWMLSNPLWRTPRIFSVSPSTASMLARGCYLSPSLHSSLPPSRIHMHSIFLPLSLSLSLSPPPPPLLSLPLSLQWRNWHSFRWCGNHPKIFNLFFHFECAVYEVNAVESPGIDKRRRYFVRFLTQALVFFLPME